MYVHDSVYSVCDLGKPHTQGPWQYATPNIIYFIHFVSRIAIRMIMQFDWNWEGYRTPNSNLLLSIALCFHIVYRKIWHK